MIKILLYDDVKELRDSLFLLLNNTEGFEVLSAFDNAETVTADIEAFQPDVILMDIDMPGTTGIEGVRAIRAASSEVKIIMLTVFDDNKNVFESLKAGANGYLLKKTSPQKLIEHIKDVYNGGAPMTSSIATQVLHMFTTFSPAPGDDHNLSDREKEVLQSLVEGNSYKMAGQQLFLSIDTIRSHVRSIYDKLQVHSKSEAVAKAIKNRIV
ncbi:MAG: response regulator transcription factor [Chitinophagaceae bacterium]|nr:MAG: response regulator transcription factor [Chitinophagaceae bacterium]